MALTPANWGFSIWLWNDNKSIIYSYKKFISKYDIDINDYHDLILFNKVKKKYFTYSNILKIITNIKDEIDRNFLYTILKEKQNITNNLFSFDVWSIYIRHAIQPCEIFNIKGKKILYIGAGDTIFHSHFIVGAGLNRSLKFSIKCANLLENLKKYIV